MYESTIAELKRNRESREKQEQYQSSLKTSTVNILRMLNDNQYKSWMLIESLIAKEVKENNLSEDQVRTMLTNGEL